jgi:histidine triad (HIT) family protein
MSDCLFCKIGAGEIPSNVVYEDDELLAFRDISPKAPTHILIIPKKHVASLADTTDADAALLGKIQILARQLAEKEGIAESGFRVISNSGADSGQEVPHLHYHLVGGRKLGDIC